MAFFNLTRLGPQNPIQTKKASTLDPLERINDDDKQPSLSNEATSSKKHLTEHSDLYYDATNLPTLTSMLYNGKTQETKPHQGSHTKFSEMRTKHQRSSKGPMDLYPYPATTSHKYGWWMKEASVPTWAKNERHAHVNSEMTRFVDEMSATNKDFSLF